MPGGREVVARPTEGQNRDLASTYKAAETKRQRGRPKGSKNKAKSLIPTEMANAILLKMQPLLTDEQFRYYSGVIAKGDAIALDKELDILILLLTRQVVPALIVETEGEQLPEGIEDPNPSPIKMPELKKEVAERLKVLQGFMEMKFKNERARDEGSDQNKKPIIEIFARRGLAGDRLRIAFEHQSGGMGGGPDEPESAADVVGEIPVAVSERPISLPGVGEGTSDRNVNDDFDRDGTRRVHEVEIRG